MSVEDDPFGYPPFNMPVIARKPWTGLQDVYPEDQTLFSEYEPVGSRITCDPPPTETDEDWIVLSEDNKGKFTKVLLDEYGFEKGGSDLVDEEDWDEDYSFVSLKLGRVNLIITSSPDFYRRFLAASSVAKRLNLLRKDDRIALFQAVLYGNQCFTREENELP
jgi:hypothetical protein